MLIQGHPRVTEWSLLHRELRPAFVRELLQVRNAATSLELAKNKSPGTDVHFRYSILERRPCLPAITTRNIHGCAELFEGNGGQGGVVLAEAKELVED
ncbi:hypothetical protein BGZ82_000507, partial [Podila clonocystis]